MFPDSVSPQIKKEGNCIGETRASFSWKDPSLHIEENVFLLYAFGDHALRI